MVMAATTKALILRVLFVLFFSVTFQIMVQPQSLPSEDLTIAKNYLEAFGYLAKNNDSKKLLEDIESATRKFQEFYNLKVSGKLYAETMKAMTKSRCGVRDDNNNHPGQQHSTWPPTKRHLTYKFIKSNVEVVPLDILRHVFQQAFSVWSQVTSFTFAEVANGAGSSSDLMVGFYRGDHGDGFPFDGPGKVVAHSFPPTDGRLNYDGDEQWSSNVPPPDNSYDLVWVAIHEIGHLLGLKHSNDPNAIMFAVIEAGKNKRTLSDDDIAAIKALYPHA